MTEVSLQVIWRTISYRKITDIMVPVRLINAVPETDHKHSVIESSIKTTEKNNLNYSIKNRVQNSPCIVTLKYKISVERSSERQELIEKEAFLQHAISLALIAGNRESITNATLQTLCNKLLMKEAGHCFYSSDKRELFFQLYRSSNVLLVSEKHHVA